ncbi:phosphoenolpyruvate--protein phosphotransferase [bacterium]|nr:phosphoenolpyruvate--protein phosphotransferase [bacterium]
MYRGIAASPGIVIGPVFVLEEEDFIIQKRKIDDEKSEIFRFRKALNKTKQEMVHTKKKALQRLGKKHARLFDAYLLILDDTMLREDTVEMIAKEKVSAEYALHQVMENVLLFFEEIDDEYFKERGQDIYNVGRKVLRHLLGRERITLNQLESQVIVVAHNLTPSDTIAMREEKVIGFATDIGGKTSHVAIMAHSLEIPAVVGLRDITRNIKDGDMIILDGNQGIVIINPDTSTLENYYREQQIFLAEEKDLEKLKDFPAVTLDGHKINLIANIEVPEEIKSVLSHGASGIGLYRTEYLYMNRKDFPSEEEQYESYKAVAKNMLPYSVTIRTLDLGGDKFSQQFKLAPERNPFLGLRAIRFCLKYPDIFKTQLRAILRASVKGKLKIMYPMISGIEELRQANKILEEVKDDLRRKKIDFDNDIEVGVMIEVPSAALVVDILVQESDFLSIGTNDLIQYLLAVDRVNENVTHLYEPLHLSILRLLKEIIQTGKKSRSGVAMCGEMAADPAVTMILLGLGLREFSMSAISIPKVKRIIRSIKIEETKQLADEILSLSDNEEIKKVLRKRGIRI